MTIPNIVAGDPGTIVGGASGGSTSTGVKTAGLGALPLKVQHLLPTLDHTLSSGFIQPTRGTTTPSTSTTTPTPLAGTTHIIVAGSTQTVPFNVAAGDKLDLSNVLAGAPLTNDLTSINKFVAVVGHAPTSTGGVKTTLEISGPSGQHAVVNLESDSKLSLDHLKNLLIGPHS